MNTLLLLAGILVALLALIGLAIVMLDWIEGDDEHRF